MSASDGPDSEEQILTPYSCVRAMRDESLSSLQSRPVVRLTYRTKQNKVNRINDCADTRIVLFHALKK